MDELGSISVSLIDVSTTDIINQGAKLYCSASITVQIPQKTMGVIKEIPKLAEGVENDYGKLYSGSVSWSKFRYRIELDDYKNIRVEPVDFNVSWALYRMVSLSVNKDEYILKNSLEKYHDEDALLNNIWMSLPASTRAMNKTAQREWIKEKVKKCGKISDATSETKNIQERIDIFKCQTSMTVDRVSLLSGPP
ncbi:lysozyme inhibitor LprI family protein [Pseudomonas sp. EL_65y_Pfl1_R32]|uniref:lysozyme inhibitor LprI family protein n=1 Tax=Pseudomonas sp. EL_65y_Pfl1_R32 TaxID=3088696 RepID=UPI0030D906FC